MRYGCVSETLAPVHGNPRRRRRNGDVAGRWVAPEHEPAWRRYAGGLIATPISSALSRLLRWEGTGLDLLEPPASLTSASTRLVRCSLECEGLADLEQPFSLLVPALRRMCVVVQIAADQYGPRSGREREVPTHRRTGHKRVVLRQLRAVDKVGTPLALDVAAPAHDVVGMGMRVPAEPEVDSSRTFREVSLEPLRLRLFVDEIEIRGTLRGTIRAMVPPVPVAAVGVA